MDQTIDQPSVSERRKPPFHSDAAARAVIQVGDGRGFVIEITTRIPKDRLQPPIRFGGRLVRPRPSITTRIIVTAAHCLPSLPPAHPGSHTGERTYESFVGPLSDAEPSIMAECLFADPVADIAVLGAPDGQDFEEADTAFEEFIEGAGALCVGAVSARTRAWLLSLDGRWIACTIKNPYHVAAARSGCGLWITDATEPIVGGMSGSPILLDDGSIIGLISISMGEGDKPHAGGGPQPSLTHCLPAWAASGIKKAATTRRSGMKK